MLLIPNPPPPAHVVSAYVVFVAPLLPSIRAIITTQSEVTQALATGGPPARVAKTLVGAVTKTEVDVFPTGRGPPRPN